MKKDEFKARVAELAIIEDAQLPQLSATARGYEEVHEVKFDGQDVELSMTNNPTINFQLIKVKPISKLCELGSCGKIVDNQVVEYRYSFTPTPHWRTRCAKCMSYLHPDGTTIIENSTQVYHIEMNWLKKGGKL